MPAEATPPLEQLFLAHDERVARAIARVTHDQARAQELAVDVIMKTARVLSSSHDASPGWFYRAAIRAALDELRRAGYRPRLPLAESGPRVSMQFVSPLHERLTVRLDELRPALRTAHAAAVAVPGNWEGERIEVATTAPAFVHYHDVQVLQAGPVTLLTPPGFPTAQLVETVFLISGNVTHERILELAESIP